MDAFHSPRRLPLGSPNGFTVFELMIALAVMAVLAAVGVPSMSSFLDDGRLSTSADDFMMDAYVARASAMKITWDSVCMTPKTVGGTKAWNNGWTVFYISTSSAAPCESADPNTTPDSIILKNHDALPNGSTLTPITPTTASAFSYGYDGRLNGDFTSVVLALDASNTSSTAKRRCVIINFAGKPSVKAVDRTTSCS